MFTFLFILSVAGPNPAHANSDCQEDYAKLSIVHGERLKAFQEAKSRLYPESSLVRATSTELRSEFALEIKEGRGPIRLSREDAADPKLFEAATELRLQFEALDDGIKLQPYQRDMLVKAKARGLKVSFADKSYADFASGTAVVDRSVARLGHEKLSAYMRHELTHLVNNHNYGPTTSNPAIIFLSEVEANLQGEGKGISDAFHITIRNNYGRYLERAHGRVPASTSPSEILQILKKLCLNVGAARIQFPNVCQ